VNAVVPAPGEIELIAGVNRESMESLPLSKDSSKVPDEFLNDEDRHLNSIDPQYLEYVNHN